MKVLNFIETFLCYVLLFSIVFGLIFFLPALMGVMMISLLLLYITQVLMLNWDKIKAKFKK